MTVVVAPPLAPARGPRRPLTRSPLTPPVHAAQTDTRLVADQARRDRRRGPRRARTRSARRRRRPCYQGARAGPVRCEAWWCSARGVDGGGAGGAPGAGWSPPGLLEPRVDGRRGGEVGDGEVPGEQRPVPAGRARHVLDRAGRGAPATEPGLHQPRARTGTSVGTGIAAGALRPGGGDEPGGGQVGDLPGRAPREPATMADHAPRPVNGRSATPETGNRSGRGERAVKPILIAMAGRVHGPILPDKILSEKRADPRSYSAGWAAGGSQAPVVNSCSRTSRLSRPHLVAVDR